MKQRILRWCAIRRNLFGVVPVIVYQMAKVGSSAVVAALDRAGLPLYHVHRMDERHLHALREQRRALGWQIPPIPAHDLLGLEVRRRLLDRGGRAKIVTLVRDPIARNFSSYFEHLEAIFPDGASSERIASEFHARFPHDEPLTWFDDEMLPVTGIDVYQHEFPESGVQTIRTERFELLILKSELPDAVKQSALSELVGAAVVLERVNRTDDKEKGAAYRQFVESVKFDDDFLARMYASRYARHFGYSLR